MKNAVENIGVLIFQQRGERLLLCRRGSSVIFLQEPLQHQIQLLDATARQPGQSRIHKTSEPFPFLIPTQNATIFP
jgi:hypothetical protein